MDGHAEHEVGAGGRCGGVLDGRPRVECDSDPEPAGACLGDVVQRVLTGLDVEGHAVSTGSCDSLEVPFRALDHEVAVETTAPRVHERRDRGEYDRADRDLRDEVAVADVEVEDACTAL